MAERLKVFPEAQIAEIRRGLDEVRRAPWPAMEGCLALLVTSRSGSTYLARELECAFAIGRLRESLNPPRLKERPAAQIVESRLDQWFSFKASAQGVIAAELCGFFDAYLPETSFVLLCRRDVVGQAVSWVKANQTRQWHSTQTPSAAAFYDRPMIAQYISVIVGVVGRLRLYARRSGRPWRALIYEDFARGDFTKAMETCDALGIPRRHAASRIRPMPVERIGDATNEAWAARFQQEMDSASGKLIDQYLTEL